MNATTERLKQKHENKTKMIEAIKTGKFNFGKRYSEEYILQFCKDNSMRPSHLRNAIEDITRLAWTLARRAHKREDNKPWAISEVELLGALAAYIGGGK